MLSKRGLFYEYSLFWVVPDLKLAIKGAFDYTNSPYLPYKLDSHRITPLAFDHYQRLSTTADVEKQIKPNGWRLVKVIYAINKVEFWFGFSVSIVCGLLTTVARPLMLREIINNINTPGYDETSLVALIVALALSLLAEGVTSIVLKHSLNDYIAVSMVTILSGLLQRKSIRATHHSMSESNMLGGDIMNMFENIKVCVIK